MENTKNIKCTCPNCGKQLELMHEYHSGDTFIELYHCEECIDGIDSDWEVTYKEDGTKNIQRYYFG